MPSDGADATALGAYPRHDVGASQALLRFAAGPAARAVARTDDLAGGHTVLELRSKHSTPRCAGS
jgi:hypothetical protein